MRRGSSGIGNLRRRLRRVHRDRRESWRGCGHARSGRSTLVSADLDWLECVSGRDVEKADLEWTMRERMNLAWLSFLCSEEP